MGFLDSNKDILMNCINRNDKQVIEKVLDINRAPKKISVANLQDLLTAKKDVIDIDQWEIRQQNKLSRIKSAGQIVRLSQTHSVDKFRL